MKPILGEQVLGHDDFTGCRVRQARSKSREDRAEHCHNRKQDTEQNGRRRQFVAGTFDDIHKFV